MSWIPHESIEKYLELYAEDSCGYGEPSDRVLIEHGERCVIQPREETNEVFLDRIERCRKTGENLFLKEWPEFQYDEEVDY